MNNHITIVGYEPRYQPYFESLNRAWIEKDFKLEALDKFVLMNPQEAIINSKSL